LRRRAHGASRLSRPTSAAYWRPVSRASLAAWVRTAVGTAARMRSTASPPHVQSSSEWRPCEPAHTMVTARPAAAAHVAAAVTLTSAAMPIASAAREASNARVPLLVVKYTVFPRTCGLCHYTGELL